MSNFYLTVFSKYLLVVFMPQLSWLLIVLREVLGESAGTRRIHPLRRRNRRSLQYGIAQIQPLEARAMLSEDVPTVMSPTSANIRSTAAILGGNVTFDGDHPLAVVGVLYSVSSINPNPQPNGDGVIELDVAPAMGLFTVNAINLTPDTQYSFVAFATNGAGTSATKVVQFTTAANTSPSFVALPSGPTSPLNGTTGVFSVRGDDLDTGEVSLTYTWALVGGIPGPVRFSDNGTNSAKSTTIVFAVPGFYHVSASISDPSGATVTETLSLYVNSSMTNSSFSLQDVPTLPLPYGGNSNALIAPAISISNPLKTVFTKATIQITGHYVAGRDVLDATPTTEISVAFDPRFGTLTLSGKATLYIYQYVLRSAVFRTDLTSTLPLTESLTLTITDGISTSAPVIRNILVNSNDVPSYPIACLGDSLTIWNGGWASALKSYYSNANVTNFGVGGYTPEQVYNTWSSQVRNSGYKMISVLAGVNDLAHDEEAVRTFGFLNRLFDEALADGLRIVVYSVTPFGGWYANSVSYWNPQQQIQLKLYNTMIAAKVAANPGRMIFCDTDKLLSDPNAPEKLSPLYDNGDGLHWNKAGHELVASTFFRHFSPNLGLSGLNASDTYIQGTSKLNFASKLIVSQPNHGNLQSATVSFTNWQGGDRLAFYNNFALQHTFKEDLLTHTATLVMTGSATAERYQATLQTLMFWCVAGQPNSCVTRHVTITINDPLQSSSVTGSVAVFPLMSGLRPNLAFLQGSAPMLIAEKLFLTLPANRAVVTSATITFSNWQEGDRLRFHNILALQHTFIQDLVAQTATLSITGSGSPFGWENQLRSVQYQDVAGTPNTSAIRGVTFTLSDGINTVSARQRITVVAAKQPPLLQVNDATNLRYQANSSPLAIMGLALASDPDSNHLLSLTIRITEGYQSGVDVLSFSDLPGITGTFNSDLGTLTLSGSKYVGNYREALRKVMFSTNGSSLAAGLRTFTMIATDETNITSKPVIRNLAVTT